MSYLPIVYDQIKALKKKKGPLWRIQYNFFTEITNFDAIHRGFLFHYQTLAEPINVAFLNSGATCSRWFLARRFFYPEDGGDTILRNVGSYRSYMALQPRKGLSSYSPP
jgi:hypothetical protein